MNDDFGDRMKAYERFETDRRLDPSEILYARLDGRGFSKFTKSMVKPFDKTMSDLMIEVAKHLVQVTGAVSAYTQSDEISLIWAHPSQEGDHQYRLFDHKLQKLASVLASIATAKFMHLLMQSEYSDKAASLPHFDCRAFGLPSKAEAANAMLWREQDCRRNAVSMAAHYKFGHKKCMHKSTDQKLLMLLGAGIRFKKYPSAFKNGTFIQTRPEEKCLTKAELETIPEQYRPTGPVMRNVMKTFHIGSFGDVANRVGFLFDKEDIVRS